MSFFGITEFIYVYMYRLKTGKVNLIDIIIYRFHYVGLSTISRYYIRLHSSETLRKPYYYLKVKEVDN